jgi:arylsulfatase A-like enzyme
MFAGMMMRLDRDVGRIMQKLKDLGIDRDTLVLFTSDNGPHAEGGKNNAFFNSSGGLRGIKRDMYEGGIREPFAARWPGRIQPGATSDHLAAFWDFTPTVLDILGAPIPENLDGISYAPVLLGQPEKQKQHDYLYWELLVGKQGRQAIRQGNLKAIRNGVKNAIELYDLSADPAEQNNIAAQNPGKVKHFEKLMTDARTDTPVFPLELQSRQ